MNMEKQDQVLLETPETEDAKSTSNNDSFPSKAGHVNYHREQMSIVGNEVDGNNKQEGYMREVMKYDSDIKREKSDEDVKIIVDENYLNYKCLEVDRTKDVKCMITGNVSLSEKCEYVTDKLDDFCNERNCYEEHRGYSVSEGTKYDVDIKEEKVDPENVVVDIEGYIKAKTADSKDFQSAEITSEYSADTSETVRQYQCNFCDYKAETEKMLLQHFFTKHVENPEWYHCQLCEFRTKCKFDLRVHLQNEHSQNNVWHCTEDVKSGDVSLSEKCANVTENNEGDCNDEHRKHSASEVVECYSNIKEGKVDLQNQVMDIEGYKRAGTVDNKGFNSAEITCKDSADTSKTVRQYQENPEWYQCQLCEFRTNLKDSMRSHFTQQHDASAEWHHCKYCKFKTKNEFSLRDHFICKHELSAEWHRCHLCDFKTDIEASFMNHCKEYHMLSNEWHNCQLCEFRTRRKFDLMVHLQNEHSQNVWHCTKDVKCMISGGVSLSEKCANVTDNNEGDCNDEHRKHSASEVVKGKVDLENQVMGVEGYKRARTVDNKGFNSAEITSKDSAGTSKTVGQYQCILCKYKAKTKHLLMQHANVKHEANPEWYKCELCKFQTKLKDILWSHIRHEHDASAEWYQCKFCEFKTRVKSSLKTHFSNKHDTSVPWYQCHLCEFKTKIKGNFATHFKDNHTSSSEWYHCKYCEFITDSKFSLRTHAESHSKYVTQWRSVGYLCKRPIGNSPPPLF